MRVWIGAFLTLCAYTWIGCRSNEQLSRLMSVADLGFSESEQARIVELKADLLQGLHLIEAPPDVDSIPWRFEFELDAAADLTQQGSIITTRDGRIRIIAASVEGISNGVYRFLADHGVVYAHPKASFIPSGSANSKPKVYEWSISEPSFTYRGFHEHTQHPIPMSTFGLEPSEANLNEVREYIRWLVRNRQNVFTFHFLNTVELEAWYPHMRSIVAYAEKYQVEVGVVIGFVDQQQNAFRLVQPSEEGESPEAQIIRRLTPIMDTGIKWIGFQIGSSEFTKPEDTQMLEWLNATVAFLGEAYPQAKPFAWIHITCGLEGNDGGSYFHLPLEADSRLWAFVHTTMFYNLVDPAPVYDCVDFSHQLDFVRAADGRREMVYFPETAWWLGFDVNIPFATPIVGPSRFRDIQLLSEEFTVSGHVTFTTGREWTYWMYDHYLTRATWDASLTWDAYLESIEPLFAPYGLESIRLLKQWTDRQLFDFYATMPDVYFYLSGELPQDELGEQAGIVARPPKRSFSSILRLPDEDFEHWLVTELAQLRAINRAYQDMFSALPALSSNVSEWYSELHRTYEVSALRARHSVTLYEGVVAIRQGDEPLALTKLTAAQSITETVLRLIGLQEQSYRYDVELLARPKPSLTAYQYGYLEEAQTGKFWQRRDEQLSALIQETFSPAPEEWVEDGGDYWKGDAGNLTLHTPNNPLLSNLLAGLMPDLLLHVLSQDDAPRLWIGVDRNQNLKPDPASLQVVQLEEVDSTLAGTIDVFAVEVVDEGGVSQGALRLRSPEFKWKELTGILSIAATLASNNVTDIVSGFGIQPEALDELLKTVWGTDRDEPLPEWLPIDFSIGFEPIHE